MKSLDNWLMRALILEKISLAAMHDTHSNQSLCLCVAMSLTAMEETLIEQWHNSGRL